MKNINSLDAKNMKGRETESIDMSLKQLGTDYIDLLLLHTPFAGLGELKASLAPNFFKWRYGKNKHNVGRSYK